MVDYQGYANNAAAHGTCYDDLDYQGNDPRIAN
jgi:hypothetical protein